jgi:D-beta-D-heptose 7-phosphate kinase/D-beta-D-heptose 1-phosphate adenosyltransferase
MSIGSLLGSFAGVRALVVGDLMLDEYVFGHASRISPEAPVMVVRQDRTKSVPGGAANVAKNIVALGGEVTVVGVVGADESGASLAEAIAQQPRTAAKVVTDPSRATTRKTRIVADHAHQVLRIDHESEEPVSDSVAGQLSRQVESGLEDCQVVVLSDYLKGVLTASLVAGIVASAKSRGVPVVANPKPKSCGHFGGVALVSLNRKEAEEVTGAWIEGLESAAPAAEKARVAIGCDAVLVTLGEAGMVACQEGQSLVAVPPKVEVYDTAGAGDTVIAVIALARAVGPLSQAGLQLAAEASARVVRHVGVAVPDERDLAEIRGL